jgi:hypothetical protein
MEAIRKLSCKLFKIRTFLVLFLLLAGIGFSVNAQKKQAAKSLTIKNIEIGYPVPAIPFYHFRADLDLPESSIIEVEAFVDGKALRANDLYRQEDIGAMDKPAMTHRPPSGYGLSLDATMYKDPTVVGWLKFNPGQSYNIKISVRMKKSVKASNDDEILVGEKTVKAPEGAKVFSTAWKNYKSVVLSETAGVNRSNEPVEVLVSFYPDELKDLVREVRVVAVDPKTYELTEVPSQVYDVQKYLKEDDLAPDKDGKPTRKVPLWMPTVSSQVAFLADVPAKSSKVFLIYYNNEKATSKIYSTDLRVQGEAPGLQIDNDIFTAILHPMSGHLDEISLKKRPDVPLYHRMETNGALHWNPDVYNPPRAWAHTADWNPPKHMKTLAGPVVSKTEYWDQMRDMPEVEASVRYEFYPGVPYFISSTSMRINETVNTLALRNAEIVLKRELITHAAWYDALRDTVIVYDVKNMADLMDLKIEADVPWITFYNDQTGVGFAGISLGYSNAGLENSPRLLNPYFYITAGPWVYWCRALSLEFLASNMQHMVPATKGSFFSEKWAYMIYEIDKGNKPYAPILAWKKKLTDPLRIHLEEEVDERVSKTVQEIFIDKGKSGWEERETSKNKHD